MTISTEKKRGMALGCLLPLLLLLHPAALAAKKTKKPDTTFDDTTDVVQVEVPVNVTTRGGDPVKGLTAENFRVFDGGQEQELVGFDVIDLSQLDAVEAEKRIEELPSVARRNFLLLFDFSFSTGSSIIKARHAAHEFVLNLLHPSDLVAIATFSLETGPRLLVTFTPDRAQLARAIDTLALARNPAAVANLDPLRFIIETPKLSTGGASEVEGTGGGVADQVGAASLEATRIVAKQIERGQKSYERNRITGWSRAMGDLARSLNGVAGRKHVVYFSEGFNNELLHGRRPASAGPERDQEMLDRVQGNLFMIHGEETHGDTLLQGDIHKMLEEFRRADCVIQAVDVAGLRAGVDVRERSKGSDSLFYMANETGGELFEASNKLTEQLDQVLDRSEVTYVLSFQPKSVKSDGKYHRLKVEVQGLKGVKGMKGIRVSNRSGYYAPRPFAGLHPMEKALLASDAIASAEPKQEVALNVLAAPFRASLERAYVPVIVEIDGVSLLAGHRGSALPIEVYAYVTNEQGEMRDYFSYSHRFDVSRFRLKIEEAGVKYYGHVELAPGKHLLRVLVRNGETGKTGVVASSIEIPEFEKAETRLLPPFFSDSPTNKWVLMRDQSRESSDGRTVPYPFTINGEPFVPSARPALQTGEAVEFCLMTYNLSAGDPALEAWVVGPDGTEQKAVGQLVERTITGISGFDKLRAQFRPKNLKGGEYRLRVSLTDPATGIQQENSIPFSIAR